MLAALLPALLPLVSQLVDRIPDPAARDKAAAEAQGQLLALMAQQDAAQTEVNRAEAQHASLFVAGWRPAAGWCCVAALAWHFIGQPIAGAIVITAGMHVTLPSLDLEPLMVLLFGLLGLGGLRSWEKAKGVDRSVIEPARKPR